MVLRGIGRTNEFVVTSFILFNSYIIVTQTFELLLLLSDRNGHPIVAVGWLSPRIGHSLFIQIIIRSGPL